jgi:hypothetical protein
MSLYFGGSEVPSWRKMLAEEGVEHVSLSYIGLRRRTKFVRPWLLAEKYPEGQKIFLDSGAYTVNSAEDDKYSQAELRDVANAYLAFVDQNLDRVDMVSEFDALALGPEYIEAMREDYWDDLPDGKFLPIWHGERLDELDRLCQRYSRVGIPQTTLAGRNLHPTLNSVVQKYGTKLHGIAMTKPDEMAAVRWDSVASTSWISPSQYGDTIVWTGNELKRYPKKYKEQARKRHRTYFESIGFNPALIEADDSTEILRLSIWSWQQQVDNLQRHKTPSSEVVTTTPDGADEANAEVLGRGVDTAGVETRNSVSTGLVIRSDEERSVLPVFSIVQQREQVVGPDGVTEERTVDLVATRSGSMRMCNGCFLKDKCPAFKPDNNCAYDIPVVVKTRQQMTALQDALIEMQSQRVLFMKMAEDMEGGYADPNLSNEVDRLQKLVKTKIELESDSLSVKFEVKGTGGNAGLISRMFGKEAGEKASALPQPMSADRMIADQNIIDVDVISDDRPY